MPAFTSQLSEAVFVLFLSCSLAVFLIWGGYPAFVALLAAARKQDLRPLEAERATVTVVIASADSLDVVNARIRDVLLADYPADLLDVIVAVDHRAELREREEYVADARVSVIRGDAPGGKAAALNAGVRQARGELLIFTDAAQRFAHSTIRVLVDALADPRLGAVSGALQLKHDGRSASLPQRYWAYEKWLRENEAKVHSAVGVTGAVYALRRDCWRPLPAGLILDDVYVPMSVVLRGLRVGFEPSARAFDDRVFTASQELRRKARTLTGVLQLCAWLPTVLVPWRNPIWAQFVFHKLLRLLTPYLLLGAAVGLAGWGSAWLAAVAPDAAAPLASVSILLGALLFLASRSLRHAVQMAVALQVAVVRATLNGLRGEWDVWRR